MKHHIVIILTLVILIIAVTCFQRKTTKEGFATTPKVSLDREYNQKLYDTYGIKKCNILSVPDNNVSSNYIDSLRIRHWRPSQSNPLYAPYIDSTDTHDYCYYFTDSNDFFPATNQDTVEAVNDPLASISECSSNNQLFRDVPFIDGVFVDNNNDVTNALPYNKCVLKINKAKATPPNVTSFWDKFKESDAFCQGFVKMVNQEVKRYQGYINDLIRSLIPFRDRHRTTSNLDSQLQRYTKSNDDLRTRHIPKSEKELNDLQSYIDKEKAVMFSEIQTLQQKASSSYEQYLTKHSHYIATSNNVVLLQDNQTLFQNALSESNALKQKCDIDLTNQKKVLSNETSLYNIKERTFNKVTETLETCNRDVKTYTTNISQARVYQEELGVGYSNVTKALKACDLERRPLPNEEKYLKDLLKEHYDKFLVCEKEKAKIGSYVEQAQRKVKALQDEIEDIKKRCRTHKGSLDLVQVDIDRTTSQYFITNQQKACETVQSLRRRRMELTSELSDLQTKLAEVKELATGCEKKKTICGCFKYIRIDGRFDKRDSDVWNDYGIEVGTRALTSEGRITTIRRYLPGFEKGEAFIRWRTSNGGKTGLYQILNTRACKKDDCANYIDVDAPIQTNGGKLVAMELFEPVK